MGAGGNKKVRLRKDLARSLRAGHPWIYRDAIEPADLGAGLSAGDIVDVLAPRGGGFVARGYADPDSPICVRVLTVDESCVVDDALVAARLGEAIALRERFIDPATTTAYRLLHGEGDYLPGVVCDRYGDVAVMRFDGKGARVFGQRVVRALPKLTTIYERSREGGALLAGAPPPERVLVSEHDLRFGVDIVHGQKTGVFLDQRDNRRRLGLLARGRVVLNCFAYTGGFSLAARKGGAARTISVDTAEPALDDARKNFALNEFDPAGHDFVCEDAFAFLERAGRRGERFGVVVLDPPSFAPSADSLERALAAYRDLNALGLRVVEPGGILATASCSSHVTPELFLQAIAQASSRARRHVRLVGMHGAGADHPVAPGHPEGRYLKFFVGVVT
jgi:23S rRNA (cytosine1962-C5)-methyltransferase